MVAEIGFVGEGATNRDVPVFAGVFEVSLTRQPFRRDTILASVSQHIVVR
jgi:hypothetical protein